MCTPTATKENFVARGWAYVARRQQCPTGYFDNQQN